MLEEEFTAHYFDVWEGEKFLGDKCPKCNSFLGNLQHGHEEVCEKCGVSVTRFGNALICKLILKFIVLGY